MTKSIWEPLVLNNSLEAQFSLSLSNQVYFWYILSCNKKVIAIQVQALSLSMTRKKNLIVESKIAWESHIFFSVTTSFLVELTIYFLTQKNFPSFRSGSFWDGSAHGKQRKYRDPRIHGDAAQRYWRFVAGCSRSRELSAGIIYANTAQDFLFGSSGFFHKFFVVPWYQTISTKEDNAKI